MAGAVRGTPPRMFLVGNEERLLRERCDVLWSVVWSVCDNLKDNLELCG